MIIHIAGPSGSGKTTLVEKIAKKYKNTIIIDTDNIDDPNGLKLLKKYTLSDKKSLRNFLKELAKKNKKDLNKIIKNNKDKNIIFAGFFHNGMKHLEKKIDKGYMIKISPDKLWRQYNLRTVTYIHKNFNEIKSLLNSRKNILKIHMIFSRKFGIRNGFECDDSDNLENFSKIIKKITIEKNYYYASSDKIYKNLTKYIT
jgi:adenylate kinase family enzyme